MPVMGRPARSGAWARAGRGPAAATRSSATRRARQPRAVRPKRLPPAARLPGSGWVSLTEVRLPSWVSLVGMEVRAASPAPPGPAAGLPATDPSSPRCRGAGGDHRSRQPRPGTATPPSGLADAAGGTSHPPSGGEHLPGLHLEVELAVHHVDLDHLDRLAAPRDEDLRDGVLDVALDRPAQRPSSGGRVEPRLLQQPLAHLARDLDVKAALAEVLVDV